jgi:hypothetical protein
VRAGHDHDSQGDHDDRSHHDHPQRYDDHDPEGDDDDNWSHDLNDCRWNHHNLRRRNHHHNPRRYHDDHGRRHHHDHSGFRYHDHNSSQRDDVDDSARLDHDHDSRAQPASAAGRHDASRLTAAARRAARHPDRVDARPGTARDAMIDDAELLRRFTYHPPQEGQPELYERLRYLGLTFARNITALTPESREQTLALIALDEVVFWANAAIARRTE